MPRHVQGAFLLRAVQKVQDTLDACELVSAHSMGTSPRVGGAEQMNHLADASFSTSTLLGFFNLVLLIVPFAIALILNCAPTLCQKLISFSVRRFRMCIRYECTSNVVRALL